jgi:hypothetical protein
MIMGELAGYALTKLIYQRGLALVYLIAFLVAANQFVPLLGEKGLLPVPLWLKRVGFLESPSLFYLFPKDAAFRIAAWLGVLLSLFALSGFSERFGNGVSAATWLALWALYLSFVNVGQVFYGFGWESMLLEAGFYAIFLGGAKTAAPALVIWMIRWMLFRTMFGAGMIKLRGDTCWKDLTCMYYHYETQPIPNPLSWFFHWLPKEIHKLSVLFNHFVELIVPFAFFAPQPFAAIAGGITLLFHGILLVSGNFSFLTLLTMVLAVSTLNDKAISAVLRFVPAAGAPLTPLHWQATLVLGAVVLLMSFRPLINLLSPRQAMNISYNPLHLVGSYGAFGSITRPRYEVIVEGTDEAVLTESTTWREYEFKAKPGALGRTPPQIAPYHLRLDWLMWFAGFSSYEDHPWFVHLMAKLLQGDEKILALMGKNPFPDAPPRYVRALLYEYHFTTLEERRENGDVWRRRLVQPYFPPVSLRDEQFMNVIKAQGWPDPSRP